jgi:hypothetical protein
MPVTIGADPEFFLYRYSDDYEGEYDEYGDRVEEPYVPSIGVVLGTKEEPYDLGDGYFCHEDNVCVELGIPPCDTADQFAHNIQEGKRRIERTFLTPEEIELVVQDSMRFQPHQLESPQAQSFGCEPDYNAYTNGEMRKMPAVATFENNRFAGGHIHLGGTFNCPPFVVALLCDAVIQLPFWCNTRSMSPPPVQRGRLQWYGQPGIFRPKPYGIEYRTPCNWWTANTNTAEAMGRKAIQLGRYLVNTNATDLRTVVRQLPWLDIQEFLSELPAQESERRDKAAMLTDTIVGVTGLRI